MVNLTATFSSLITANHILHYHQVLDGYGHISVRSPNNNATFYLAADIAPALVEKPEDFVEYRVSDAQPVDPNAPNGYIERYIHSEILKKYPEVNVVVHSHSEDVVPYASTGVPFKPMLHMAGFLGPNIPDYDIAKYYNDSDTVHDLLVRTPQLGARLADLFTNNGSSNLDQTFVLMRGHGFSLQAPTIELAVYRAVYAQTNAKILTKAIALSAQAHGQVQYLSLREQEDTALSIQQTAIRPWQLWVREVETYPGGLYRNILGSPPDSLPRKK